MLNETVRKNTLVPFILRIALAAIFLYNGAAKIAGRGNDLGASWADHLWAQQGSLPAGVLAHLDALPGEPAEEIERIKNKLNVSYGEEAGTLPATLRFSAAQLAVAWGEVLCGVALLIGLLTRGSAVAMILVQLGAIWTVTLAHGFSSAAGGYEFNLALVAMCVALLILGGGSFSVDRLWSAYRQRRQAVRGGLEAGLFGQPAPAAQPVRESTLSEVRKRRRNRDRGRRKIVTRRDSSWSLWGGTPRRAGCEPPFPVRGPRRARPGGRRTGCASALPGIRPGRGGPPAVAGRAGGTLAGSRDRKSVV